MKSESKKLKIEPTPVDMEGRLCVELFDNEGVLVERSYGPSTAELKAAHDKHECGALVGPWCGFCYHDAMVSQGLE